MDHTSRVELFLEVVKRQSFAAAARHLGMTGPALSKQVQTLEDQLGVRLLHRTTRQVTLTEEGALYSERARKAMEDLREAEQQIQDLSACPTGMLKVNAPVSFGIRHLSDPIARFAQKYPNVRMEVDFSDRNVDVIGEGYDVVIRIGALEDSTLIARQLAPCPVLLCASPALVRKYGTPKTPEDLKELPAIIYAPNAPIPDWQYIDPKQKTGTIRLNRKFTANNGDIMLHACLHGVGIAQLPIFSITEHLKSGDLIQLLPDYSTHPERTIHALFPQNRHLSTRVRLFVDWLTEYSGEFPWIQSPTRKK